jgi:hypothetical protein
MNTTEFEALSRAAMYEYIKEHWPEDAKGKSRARRDELVEIFVRHQPLTSSEVFAQAVEVVLPEPIESIDLELKVGQDGVEETGNVHEVDEPKFMGALELDPEAVKDQLEQSLLEQSLTPLEVRLIAANEEKKSVAMAGPKTALSSPKTMEITVPTPPVRLPGALLRAVTDYAQIPAINRKFRRIKRAKYVTLAKKLAPYNLNVDEVAADPGRYA